MLKDKCPGPITNIGIPPDGWDGTSHCCVTKDVYSPGTKFAQYTDNSNNPGWYTMMYGCLAEFSETNHCVSGDISDGLGWCAHTCLTEDVSSANDPTYISPYWNGESQPFWVMSTAISATACTKDISGCGQVCLPCSSLGDNQWGWFWVGGVCPCKDVTFLDDVSAVWTGADMTAIGVVAGNWHLCITGGSALMTGADWSATVDATIPTGVNYEPSGYALRASA